jgi:hypothetical protein
MSNQKDGSVYQSVERMLALYDALHPRLREVLRRAPYNYAVNAADRKLRGGGGDVEARRKEMIANIQSHIGRLARKTYGTDHPQATPAPQRKRGSVAR